MRSVLSQQQLKPLRGCNSHALSKRARLSPSCPAPRIAHPLRLCRASSEQQQIPSSAAALQKWVLPLSSPLLALALPNAAWADYDDAAEQAAAALYDQDTGSSGLMVSILAGIVFLLLVVVTGGVSGQCWKVVTDPDFDF